MPWNKRTALVALSVLLPAAIVATYVALPKPPPEAHVQMVTPTAAKPAAATAPETKEATNKADHRVPPSDTSNQVAHEPPPQVGKEAIAVGLAVPPGPQPKPLPPAADLTSKAQTQDGSPPLPPGPPVIPVIPPPDTHITKVSGIAEPSSPPPTALVGNPNELSIRGPAVKVATTEIKCPWTLHLEIVKGRTILTAETGKAASFRIDCERLELKAPQGNIQAVGNVKISGTGLEGNSDRLTVNLQEDQVILEGRAALVSRRQGENIEVKGERLCLRLVKTSADDDEKPTATK
jgi:hypothetical protein